MTKRLSVLIVFAMFAGCPAKPPVGGGDCAQDGTCPQGLRCFPDFRCYPPTADPACDPPCYGTEPFCDKEALRCVACLADADCEAGFVCVPPIKRCQAGCSEAHPSCPIAGTKCDLTLGACRGCKDDTECPDPVNKRCDAASGLCAPCVPDRDDCPAGTYCGGSAGLFACTAGCKGQSDCTADGGAPSMDCCNHRCVDTASATDNCGVCNNVCRNNKSCCSGSCSDLTSDPDNCSACGATCALPNVINIQCVSSHCTNRGCESYFGNCDADMTNGCETNLSYNPLHCSTCTNVCAAPPHGAAACNLTVCGLGACDTGWGNCDSNPGNGCETPLLGLPNCGACGNTCDAGQSCDAGQCF